MAWNNNQNNNNGNYNNNRSYNSQNNGNYQNNQPKKKHSGATHSTYFPETGANKGVEQRVTNGWMYRRNVGLVSYSAVTTKFTKLSDKGWYGSVFITVIQKNNGQKNNYWGTMQKNTGKVVCSDLGIVINPKAKNGGYCGTYTK